MTTSFTILMVSSSSGLQQRQQHIACRSLLHTPCLSVLVLRLHGAATDCRCGRTYEVARSHITQGLQAKTRQRRLALVK